MFKYKIGSEQPKVNEWWGSRVAVAIQFTQTFEFHLLCGIYENMNTAL